MRIFLVILIALCCEGPIKNDTIKTDTVKTERIESGKWTATYYGGPHWKAARTASGEKYDPYGNTCASMVHKFGTRLKVTNLNNGKTVIVTVNDRGRFPKNMLDLSYGAFGRLSEHKKGRIPIKVEIIK